MRRKLSHGLLDGSRGTEDEHPPRYGQFQLAQEQISHSSLHSVINKILNRLLSKLKPLEPQKCRLPALSVGCREQYTREISCSAKHTGASVMKPGKLPSTKQILWRHPALLNSGEGTHWLRADTEGFSFKDNHQQSSLNTQKEIETGTVGIYAITNRKTF